MDRRPAMRYPDASDTCDGRTLDFPLYFLRHGETFFNAEGRLQGQLDTALSPLGREQAIEAGRTLAEVLRGAQVDPSAAAWYASPLSRAVDTMTLARGAFGLPKDGFTLDDRLKELSFGAWENLTWPEVRERDPSGFARRQKDVWDFVPPGGESYAMLRERVRAWMALLNGVTVCVAHGGVARALMTLIGGLSPQEAAKAPVLQGRVLAFRAGRGVWV